MAPCTVERLMRELGLEGVMRGRRRRTTVPEPSAPLDAATTDPPAASARSWRSRMLREPGEEPS